jgi:hypothetical protein
MILVSLLLSRAVRVRGRVVQFRCSLVVLVV